MTRRELVQTALAHQPVPRVPYNVGFTVSAREKMEAFYGDPNFASKLGNCLHMISVLRVDWGKRDAAGWYVDEFGTRWNRSVDADIGMPIPSLTRKQFYADRFDWPDPLRAGRFDTLVAARLAKPDKFLIMSVDLSLFERAWVLVGMEEFLSAMVTDPDFARALLERIADFNVQVVRAGLAACPDVDGVIFGDDFGTQLGVMMGPKLWRNMIGPCVARQYAAVRQAGKKVFIHSCGKVDDLFEDFVALGVDCFNPFQPEVIDVFAAKERYRGRLAFYGGISTQKLLPYGSPGEVREKVAELLERIGKSGGYIASPAHAIPGDAPAENIHAMLEVLKTQP